MRIPQQVSERVKEAPAQALRAVFSGIGQVLLVADRIKSRAAEPERAPSAPSAASAPAEPEPQSSATTVKDEHEVTVKTGFGATIRKRFDLPMPAFLAFETDSIEKATRCTRRQRYGLKTHWRK